MHTPLVLESLCNLEEVLDHKDSIDAGVASGTRRLIGALRLSIDERGHSPYTVTSRRYSVWALVRMYLDAPFGAFAERYEHLIGLTHASIFRLSEIHKCELATGIGGSDPSVRSAKAKSRYKQKLDRIGRWEKFFKERVRKSQANAKAAGTAGAIEFERTLDFVQAEVLFFVKGLAPYSQRPSHLDDVSSWTQHTRGVQNYCELCWRPTQCGEHRQSGLDGLTERPPNKRFCREHDPRDPRSRYRVDHRYKRAFQNEVRHLQRLSHTEYRVPFPVPEITTNEEIRRAAYDLVHAGFHSPDPDRKRRYSLKERVYVLKSRGLSQSEIARTLGVSRQAVSKAWKRTQEILAQRQPFDGNDSHIKKYKPRNLFEEAIAVDLEDGVPHERIVQRIGGPDALIRRTIAALKRRAAERGS